MNKPGYFYFLSRVGVPGFFDSVKFFWVFMFLFVLIVSELKKIFIFS